MAANFATLRRLGWSYSVGYTKERNEPVAACWGQSFFCTMYVGEPSTSYYLALALAPMPIEE